MSEPVKNTEEEKQHADDNSQDKAPESDTVMTMESEENAPKESITGHQDDKVDDGSNEGMGDVDTHEQEELDYEPAKEDNKDEENMEEIETVEEDEGYEIEGDLTRLRCINCEFLKFKNIDEWKNHFIGHWRLSGMQGDKTQCFVKGCMYSQSEPNISQRLSKLGQHFIDEHKFKQAAYRKCEVCKIEFYEERKYNTHMKKHDPSFTCDLCKKNITGKLWFRKHIEKCYGDTRPSWARQPVEVEPGEDKEVLEIYGKEYDVRWGTVTNTFTKKTRICARAWIEGKGWVGRGETRDEARNMLIKALKNHIKRTMDKGLYTLEDGEIVPEPTLSETPAPPTASSNKKSSCPQCGTQFSKRANLELHMFMHRNDGKKKKRLKKLFKMAMNKNRLNVRLPPEVNRVLYVRNLPYKITAEEMYDIFGKYGAIRQIRVGNTTETRGTAFVIYEDIFDAKNACDHLSGFNVCNRYLVVLYYQANKAFEKINTAKKEDDLIKLKEKYDLKTPGRN